MFPQLALDLACEFHVFFFEDEILFPDGFVEGVGSMKFAYLVVVGHLLKQNIINSSKGNKLLINDQASKRKCKKQIFPVTDSNIDESLN